MWNDFVEKAKKMAADVDQQLNESVGLEVDNKQTKTKDPAITRSTIGGAQDTTNINISGIIAKDTDGINALNDDGDAWNDDFDLGDDEYDEIDNVVVPQKEIQPKEVSKEQNIISEKTKEKVTQPLTTPDVSPPFSSLQERKIMTTIESTSKKDFDSTESKQHITNDTDTSVSSASETVLNHPGNASIQKSDNINSVKSIFSLAQKMTTDAATGGVTSLLTTMNHTTPNLGVINTSNNNRKTKKKNDTDNLSSSSLNEMKEQPSLGDEENNDAGWDQDVDLIGDDADNSGDAVHDKNYQSNPNNLATTIETNDPVNNAPAPAATTKCDDNSGSGGIFSNLSNLAPTADTLITAAIDESDDDDNGEESKNIAVFENTSSSNFNILVTKNELNESINVDTNGKYDEHNMSAAGFEQILPAQQEETVVKSKAAKFTTKEIPSLSCPVITHTTKYLHGQQSQKQDVKSQQNESPAIGTSNINIEDDPRFKELQNTLYLREEQLMDKGGQLNELQSLLEIREQKFKQKLNVTKEKANKGILQARERCKIAESKLQAMSSGLTGDASKQQQVIDELRQEGQALAMKQATMEQAVRGAKAETRSLIQELEQEASEKEQALQKIVELENSLKSTKGSLTSAREGESQAKNLENDLLAARADGEDKENKILSLQQRMKELIAESKELQNEINATRKSAAHEAQQDKTFMRKEHNDLVSDLEIKLRTTEREAGVREDALRHEVAEIRKRWQDTVRRADALSMDMQSTTAPLLRQLESMERQSRLRAANAAELESRLRSELEENTIENENLGKSCSELKSKSMRLERVLKERNEELVVAKNTIDEQTRNIEKLGRDEEKLVSEAEKRQIEYEKVERLANEGVSLVRREMAQTVIDSEERYRDQIKKMEKELKIEQEKRTQLENQVGKLLETTGGGFTPLQAPHSTDYRRESKPKKLHKAEGQAEILADALGLGDETNDDTSDDESVFDPDSAEQDPSRRNSFNSFAALEQLTSKLKSAEVDLISMRTSLKESNESRQSMVEELGEGRHAKEKLPLFEFKVKELSQENREMELEIAGLKEDIADVRDLYRTQLNVLLEEKTASMTSNNDIDSQ